MAYIVAWVIELPIRRENLIKILMAWYAIAQNSLLMFYVGPFSRLMVLLYYGILIMIELKIEKLFFEWPEEKKKKIDALLVFSYAMWFCFVYLNFLKSGLLTYQKPTTNDPVVLILSWTYLFSLSSFFFDRLLSRGWWRWRQWWWSWW